LVCKGAEGGRWRDPGKISLQGISVSFLSQPTEWNVRDSDTTVLFPPASELTGGSKKTAEFAKKHHKTWIHLAAGDPDVAQRPTDWLVQNAVEVLNVEGLGHANIGIATLGLLKYRYRKRKPKERTTTSVISVVVISVVVVIPSVIATATGVGIATAATGVVTSTRVVINSVCLTRRYSAYC
jgi:hypothetical protein